MSTMAPGRMCQGGHSLKMWKSASLYRGPSALEDVEDLLAALLALLLALALALEHFRGMLALWVAVGDVDIVEG